jgi:hypothetical protein
MPKRMATPGANRVSETASAYTATAEPYYGINWRDIAKFYELDKRRCLNAISGRGWSQRTSSERDPSREWSECESLHTWLVLLDSYAAHLAYGNPQRFEQKTGSARRHQQPPSWRKRMLAPATEIKRRLTERPGPPKQRILGRGATRLSDILDQFGTYKLSLIGIGGTGGPLVSAETGCLYKLLVHSEKAIGNEASRQSPWLDKLNSFRALTTGWNGYDAPAPSERALAAAESFLEALQLFETQPSRVGPSAIGGVGITLRRRGRKAYFEFYNDGNACALFSDGESEPITRDFQASRGGYYSLIAKARVYLNA